MKGIRRFQRTMITLLVGINILVFSTSFYGDLKAACAQSLVAMCIVASILLTVSFFRFSKKNKKTTSTTLLSKEHEY